MFGDSDTHQLTGGVISMVCGPGDNVRQAQCSGAPAGGAGFTGAV